MSIRCVTKKWPIAALIVSSLLLANCGEARPAHNEEIIEDDELLVTFLQEPPEELVAGDLMDASVSVHRGDEPLAGAEVRFVLQGLSFGDGEYTATSVVEADGTAEISRSLRQATRQAVLFAMVEDEDGSEVTAASRPFDVVAAEADAGESFVVGDDGFVGDDVVVNVGLFDRFGNPLPGVAPIIELTGVGELVGECSNSDETGSSTCVVTSETVGETTPTLVDPVDVDGEAFWFVSPDCDLNGAPFGGGAGTQDDPYTICSGVQLQRMAEYLNAAFELAANVDLSEETSFIPIGSEEAPFEGTLYGQGLEIYGLRIHAPDDANIGLFGVIGDEGSVRSLGIREVDVHGRSYVGGLAGQSSGQIIDIHVTGSVTATSYGGGLLVGGLEDSGAVSHSSSRGMVEVVGRGAGGLVGVNNYGVITRSYSTASVVVPPNSSDSDLAGGLVGGNAGEVYDSYATGDITVAGRNVGGLTGRAWTTVARSYSTGVVVAGGDPDYIGGFVGLPHFGAVEDSYWDTQSSGISHDRGADPLETMDFSDMANFPGWDFDDVWIIGTAPDGVTRPILRWQVETED